MYSRVGHVYSCMLSLQDMFGASLLLIVICLTASICEYDLHFVPNWKVVEMQTVLQLDLEVSTMHMCLCSFQTFCGGDLFIIK